MPMIVFVEANGAQYDVEIAVGDTLMQGAVDNGIDGILAECGGCCSCGTCQCYVDDEWAAAMGKPNDIEATVLEGAREEHANARLSCQVHVTADMEGMVVRLPESQY